MIPDLPPREQTTSLLLTADRADAPALAQIVPRVYDELRMLARRQLAREHRNPTLQTTELVHEAYVRLVDQTRVTERGRAYFFGAAARAMRRVLIDAARRRGADKRGAGVSPLTLDEKIIGVDGYAEELLDLDRALARLEALNARHARVVECRYFGGLTVEETAEALGISPRTVKSDWALARAWLFTALRGAPPEAAS